MSDTLTDAHHDWVTKFTGVDTRGSGTPPADTGSGANPSAAGGAPGNGGDPTAVQTPSSTSPSAGQSTDPGTAQSPEATTPPPTASGDPSQASAADPNAGQSPDPASNQTQAAADPNTAQSPEATTPPPAASGPPNTVSAADPNAAPDTDPNANQSVDPSANQSVDPNAAPAADPNAPPAADANAAPSPDPNAAPGTDPSANQSVDPTAAVGADPNANQSVDPSKDKPAEDVGGHQLADARTPDVLGPAQKARAEAMQAKLSPDDQKKYQDMLDGAKSDTEKAYIQKGLAAGHSMDELKAFQSQIAGKDDKWMQDQLNLTADSNGKGIKQQWNQSCQATMVEAVKGQMDPIYALKLRQDNPNANQRDDKDGGKLNPGMAAEQKDMLESPDPNNMQGRATSVADQDRKDGDPKKDEGAARMSYDDLLKKQEGTTGVHYDDFKPMEKPDQAALDDIAAGASKGMPVPIGVSDGEVQHSVLVTKSDAGPPRTFAVFDPWTGGTTVHNEDDFKNGTLGIAADPKTKKPGFNKITGYSKPNALPAN